MSSLRVAMKLSLAESKGPPVKEGPDSINDAILSGRKRNSSIGEPTGSISSATKAKRARLNSKDTGSAVAKNGSAHGNKSTASSSSSVGSVERDEDERSASGALSMDEVDEQPNQEDSHEHTESLAAVAEGGDPSAVALDYVDTSVKVEESSSEVVEQNSSLHEEVTQSSSVPSLEVPAPEDSSPAAQETETAAINIAGEGETPMVNQSDLVGGGAVDDEEVPATASAKKPKKKRVPSMLRALGIELTSEPMEDSQLDDDGRRHGSNRSAAVAAKSKMNTKGARATDDESTRKRSSSTVNATASSATDASNLEWVQCDRCSKWRSISLESKVRQSELPDLWYCEMNTWSKYNNCEVPEEVAESDHGEDTTQAVVSQPEKSRSRGGGGRSKARKDTEDVEKRDADPSASSRRGRGGRSASSTNLVQSEALSPSVAPSVAEIDSQTNWVQCNKCSKWRKVPGFVEVEKLPETWYCDQNIWNPLFANCSVGEETDDPVELAVSKVVATTPGKAPPSEQPAPASAAKEKGGKRSRNAAAANGATPTGGQSEVRNTNWVRCEMKGCKKWRKVPLHIDMGNFPEKWYCHMNTWNPDTASCDVPEESDNEGQSQNVFSNCNATGTAQKTLSYRKLLFGNDGRLRICFTDKNKLGSGIFTQLVAQAPVLAGEVDEECEPRRKVAYWWNSSYNENVAFAQMSSRPNKSTTASLKCKEKERDSEEVDQDTPVQSMYMLDAIRRMFRIENRVPPPFMRGGKRFSKSQRIIAELDLFQRLQLECVVVRSSFLACTASNVLFSVLLSIISNSRFADPIVEACRDCMTANSLKATLRRMELDKEVEVFHTKDAQLVVCLLMDAETMHRQLAVKVPELDAVINQRPYGEKWAKTDVPLKLRKFFVDPNHVLNIKHAAVAPTLNAERSTRRSQRNSISKEPQSARKKSKRNKAGADAVDEDAEVDEDELPNEAEGEDLHNTDAGPSTEPFEDNDDNDDNQASSPVLYRDEIPDDEAGNQPESEQVEGTEMDVDVDDAAVDDNDSDQEVVAEEDHEEEGVDVDEEESQSGEGAASEDADMDDDEADGEAQQEDAGNDLQSSNEVDMDAGNDIEEGRDETEPLVEIDEAQDDTMTDDVRKQSAAVEEIVADAESVAAVHGSSLDGEHQSQ